MDNFFKGLSVFQDGMQQLAVNQGIMGATEQVNAINSSMMEEMQKRQAKQQLASQLALQLTGIGAAPHQVATAMGAIGPAPIRDSNDAYQQAVASGDQSLMGFAKDMQQFENKPKNELLDKTQGFEAEQKRLDRQNALDIAKSKNDKRMTDTELSVVREQSKLFEQHSEKYRGIRDNANSALTLLQSDNPLADTASIVGMIRASGDASVITDADRKLYGGAKGWADRLSQAMSEITSGKLSDSNRKFMVEVAKIHQKRGEAMIEDTAKRFATRASRLTGVSYESAFEKIYAGAAAPAQAPAADAASAGSPAPGIPAGFSKKPIVDASGNRIMAWVSPDGQTAYPVAPAPIAVQQPDPKASQFPGLRESSRALK